MSIAIKICGVKRPEDIDALNGLGVDMVGFNFYKPSPRYLDMPTAAQLATKCRPEMSRVALLVDPDNEAIDQALAAASPSFIQLHGHESPERVAEIKQRSYCSLIKTLAISEAADFEAAHSYAGLVDLFLFDAKPLPDRLPGGNGEVFDWTALTAYEENRPYLLAGGLTADNVATALAETGAPMVDISSGVESAPGEKHAGKMADFVNAVRAAEKRLCSSRRRKTAS